MAPRRIVGMPPPPAHVQGRSETVFADEFAFRQERQDRLADTPAKRIVHDLIKAARQLNFTAAPPAHIRPHIWSEPVDISSQVTVAAGAPSAYQTVCSFTTPPGRWARIEHYGVQVVDPLYTYDGEIAWGFRLNGRLLDQGMSGWSEQRGSMVFMRPAVILMNREQITLEFLVRRAIAGVTPRVVQMGFRGWTYLLRNNYEGTQGSVTAY